MSEFIQSVNRLAGLSEKRLINQQSAYVPRFVDGIEYIAHRYILNGITYNSWLTDEIYLKINKDVLFLFNKRIPAGIYNLEELFADKVLGLFMLFINGLFVRYECMSLIIDDYNDYYILISKENEYFNDLAHNIKYLNFVILPGDISYSKSSAISNVLFSFNEYGKFDMSEGSNKTVFTSTEYGNRYGALAIPTEVLNVDISGKYTSGLDFPFDQAYLNENNIKLSDKNLILFIDGYLKSGDIAPVGRSTSTEVTNEDGSVSTVNKVVYQSCEEINPSVGFKMNLLTINNGENLGESVYACISLSKYFDQSIDNIYKINQNFATNEVIKSGENQPLLGSFNPDNTNNLIEYIMQYNPSILNGLIKEYLNVSVEKLEYASTKKIPVHHKYTDDGILVFVNGKLYDLRNLTYSDNGYCTINMSGIADPSTAIIEMMRFKNINNSSGYIRTGEWIGTDINLTDGSIELFSKEASVSGYTYPSYGLQLFKVDYTVETRADGLCKITTNDPFYMNKTLQYYGKNRFIAKSFVLSGNSDDEFFEIDLGNYFYGCHRYYNFMIFMNGNRLTSDMYRLVLPCRQTTPFTDFRLYLSVPFTKNDTISIVYAPCATYDIPIAIDQSTGDITVDNGKFNYQVSKSLSTIWINGNKVPDEYIEDIGYNKLHLSTDVKSIKYAYIVKYVEDLDELEDIINRSRSEWDKNVVDNSHKNTMLEISDTTITNSAADSYADKTDIAAIMHEVIRDQFVRKFDVTKPFDYGYTDIDTSVIGDDENNTNIVNITTMDSNKIHSIPLPREDDI